jgi:protease-4
MERSRARILLIIFLLFFLIVVPAIALIGVFSLRLPVSAERMVLVARVQGEFPDYPPSFSTDIFLARKEPNMTDLLMCLEQAEKDDRVETVVLKVLPSGAGAAKCEELSSAIFRLRMSGKQVIAFSPILIGSHYLAATAADSLFMPPSGYLVIPGVSSSAMFMRGTFDKLGITPNIHRIGEYKSAAEMLTETKRSPASREMIEWILEDRYGRFVETVAERRDAAPETVTGWIDRGIWSPQRAYDNGLIDGVRFWDQLETVFEEQELHLVDMYDYLEGRSMGYIEALESKVAVVHVQGRIVTGRSGFDIMDGNTAGSETVIAALRKARDNTTVKAVVLRIDSPGGDAFAGDMISREVQLASRVKPVVVSMSDVAASGGYQVAYRADKIIALPGSITGSIGSITGKLNLRGFYDRIGITKDEIGIGDKALIFSDYRDFTEEELRVIEEEHYAFYFRWIEDIALHRDMRIGQVDSLARGRVWTGEQAAGLGLVDETGGLRHAVEIACQLADIDDPSSITVVHLPKRKTFLQGLLSRGFLQNMLAYNLHLIIYRDLAPREPLFFRHEL